MDKEELAEKISNREIIPLYVDLSNQLSRLKPNGAKIHLVTSRRAYFIDHARMYKSKQERFHEVPLNETFSQLKERKQSQYDRALEVIIDAMEFGARL